MSTSPRDRPEDTVHQLLTLVNNFNDRTYCERSVRSNQRDCPIRMAWSRRSQQTVTDRQVRFLHRPPSHAAIGAFPLRALIPSHSPAAPPPRPPRPERPASASEKQVSPQDFVTPYNRAAVSSEKRRRASRENKVLSGGPKAADGKKTLRRTLCATASWRGQLCWTRRARSRSKPFFTRCRGDRASDGERLRHDRNGGGALAADSGVGGGAGDAAAGHGEIRWVGVG